MNEDWLYEGEEEAMKEVVAAPVGTVHSFDANGDPIYYNDCE